MPLYEYGCPSCGNSFELVQAMKSAASATCPKCKSKSQRKFSAPGIVFKGSGFYKTDSRKSPTKELN